MGILDGWLAGWLACCGLSQRGTRFEQQCLHVAAYFLANLVAGVLAGSSARRLRAWRNVDVKLRFGVDLCGDVDLAVSVPGLSRGITGCGWERLMCSSAISSQSPGMCFDAEKLVCRWACSSTKLQRMGLALWGSRVLKMCCTFNEH